MKRKLILTDVDGTLTKKSVVLSHAGYLINHKIIKDDGSFKAWSSDMKNESLIVAVAENYRKEIQGKEIKELRVKEFMSGFINNKDNWYPTLKELEAIRTQDNIDIILVTGSSDFLIKELASYLNCQFKATKYLLENNRLTGNVIGMFSETQKKEFVQKEVCLSHYEYIEAWGDTTSDYGLFQYADYKRLVEPTKETLVNLIQKTKIDEII